MKLIDILVEELPLRGGWPEDSHAMSQSGWDSEIYTGSKILPDFYIDGQAEDNGTRNLITQAEYEAALEVSKQPKWDGVGLPPVGAEVEVLSPSSGWKQATVTAITDNWLIAQYEDGVEYAGAHRALEPDGTFTNRTNMFRKVKSQAERQREATVASLQESLKGSGYSLPNGAASIVLDAIAQGKVFGIKLAD